MGSIVGSGFVPVAAAVVAGGCIYGGDPVPSYPYTDGYWLEGPSSWQPIDDRVGGCRASTATDLESWWPGIRFKECGSGLRCAPVTAGNYRFTADTLKVACRRRGEELLVSLTALGAGVDLLSTMLLGSGTAVSLVSAHSCQVRVASGSSPLLLEFMPYASVVPIYGWLDVAVTPAAIRWLELPPAPLKNAFDFGSGFGAVFAGGSLRITRDPASPELHEVHVSTQIVGTPVGDDGRIFWSEADPLSGTGRILALGRDDSLTQLASGSWYPAALGVSSSRVVWLGAPRAGHPRDPIEYGTKYESLRVYSCPRDDEEATPCDAGAGLELPIDELRGAIVTDGDRVAFSSCRDTACHVYLVDLSTQEVTQVPEPDGGAALSVLGFSSDALFLASFEQLVRFAL